MGEGSNLLPGGGVGIRGLLQLQSTKSGSKIVCMNDNLHVLHAVVHVLYITAFGDYFPEQNEKFCKVFETSIKISTLQGLCDKTSDI